MPRTSAPARRKVPARRGDPPATALPVAEIRAASRELVRELGFLGGRYDVLGLPHSHCHALLEIERAGDLAQSELPGLLRLDKSSASRIVRDLVGKRLVKAGSPSTDRRVRRLTLTRAGTARLARVHDDANARVEGALALLSEADRDAAVRGLSAYVRALERSRRRAQISLRRVLRRDRAGVASLIRDVMPEFGAEGPGFAILDPEVDDMPAAYSAPRSAYWVLVTREPRGRERVVGGGGFAPLAGGQRDTCELRKMYFRAEVRGLGLGCELLETCVSAAREAGFRRVYLETLGHMHAARALYEANGFRPLRRPEGATGHFGCNAFYARVL